MRRYKIGLLLVAFATAGFLAGFTGFQHSATQAAGQQGKALRKPDIHYVPTPPEVVRTMLKMAGVKKGDVVYDLGCGDGRIVIAAAQEFGVRGVGIDIDPERIKEAEENARRAGVDKLVKFRHEDIFEADFKEASVVTLYLLERLNEKLKPRLLEQLKPGSRIVSHAFGMGDWPPEKTEDVDGRMVYMWTVPAQNKSAK